MCLPGIIAIFVSPPRMTGRQRKSTVLKLAFIICLFCICFLSHIGPCFGGKFKNLLYGRANKENKGKFGKSVANLTKTSQFERKTSGVSNSKYKDDFDDGSGFYNDGVSSTSHTSNHSSRHDFTGGPPSSGAGDGTEIKGGQSYSGLMMPTKESSYSLISFITFANFLLFVLHPLFTLPKRQRLAYEFHQRLLHEKKPPVLMSGPNYEQGYHGVTSYGHGYEHGPPPEWVGSDVDEHQGYGPTQGSGGPTIYEAGGGAPLHPTYDHSPGYHSGSGPWENSGAGYNTGNGQMMTGGDGMAPGKMPSYLMNVQKQTKSKKKKKKMKTSGSEDVPVFNSDFMHFGGAQTQFPNTNTPDDSILSKDEILQILQNLGSTT